MSSAKYFIKSAKQNDTFSGRQLCQICFLSLLKLVSTLNKNSLPLGENSVCSSEEYILSF